MTIKFCILHGKFKGVTRATLLLKITWFKPVTKERLNSSSDGWLENVFVRLRMRVHTQRELPSACLAAPAAGSWAAESACCPPRSSSAGSCPVPVWAAPPRSCRHPADSEGSHSPLLRLLLEKHLRIHKKNNIKHGGWNISVTTERSTEIITADLS